MEFQRAPIAPNAAVLLMNLIEAESDENGLRWKVNVLAVEDYNNLPNLLNGVLGEIITINVQQQMADQFVRTHRFKARVALSGNERGSRYVLQAFVH